MVLTGGTLHVMYVSPSSDMHTDIATVRALELIKPMKANTTTQGSRGGSLFWWLTTPNPMWQSIAEGMLSVIKLLTSTAPSA